MGVASPTSLGRPSGSGGPPAARVALAEGGLPRGAPLGGLRPALVWSFRAVVGTAVAPGRQAKRHRRERLAGRDGLHHRQLLGPKGPELAGLHAGLVDPMQHFFQQGLHAVQLGKQPISCTVIDMGRVSWAGSRREP